MKCAYCVICQDIIQDIQAGLVSLIKITDAVTCEKLPITLPQLCFFAYIQKSIFEQDIIEGLLSIKQGGKVSNSMQLKADFSGKTKLNMVFKFEMFHITNKGDIEISLAIGNKEVASAKIEVKIGTPNIIIPKIKGLDGHPVM